MKRLQYFAMLCVFVTLFAGSAWGAVAKIGSTEYADLSTLATAIGGTLSEKTIKLSDDKTLGGTLIISTDTELSLDLNGKTLSFTGLGIYNNGKLTIIDTTGNGKVVSSNYAIMASDNSTLILGSKENSSYNNFSVEAQEAAVSVAQSKNATFYVYGGTYTTKDNGVFMTNGTAGCHGHKWYIYDGTFNGNITSEGYVACGIYAPNSDDWYVYGGTFNITKGTGILARAGTVHIPEDSKVVINTTGNVTGKVGDSRVVVPCAPIVFDTSAGYPGLTDDSKIIIGGGTFSSEVDNISFVSKDNDVIANRFNVTGGNFTSDPTSYLASTKYKVAQKDSKYYVVKEILSSDITNLKATAITYGQTLADSTITATVTFSGDVVSSSDYKLAWKDPTIKPSVSDSDKTSYDVLFTISDDTKYSIDQEPSLKLTVTVNPADSSVTTAPTAVASLVANGTAQALITAGTAENGTMQYALGENATTAPTTGYSTTIPTGTDAGTYYVWYKVVGDANHNNTEAKCITVTITAKAAATLSSFDVTISGDTALTATYGTSATKTFTASVKAGYSDGTTASLTSGYTLAWSTASTDLADYELSFSNGTLTVSDLADVGTYNVPITATVTSGSIKGTATVTAKVTVNNIAPVLSSTASTVTAKQGERITNVTVTATKGANIAWSTNGTLPTGLTYTTTATTFVIAGTVSASADVKTYDYSVIATNNISSATQKVTFTINSADVVVVQSDDQNPEKATIKAEDLKNATAEQLAEALTGKTELAIEGTVSNTEFAETLTKLASTGITALDLSSVSGLTTVDLKSNSKIETLDLGTNSSVKTVELSSTSSVKSMSLANSKVTTVNAEGCTSLTSVDVSGNTTIQTLTLTNTGVGDLNVASCDNLQTLETGSCESLEKVTLSGCKNLKTFKTSNSSNLKSIEGYQDCAETLTDLDVSSCSLLRIDLANFKVLKNPNLGGQKRTGASILRKFSWWRFFFGNWWPSEATEQEGDVDYTKLIKITKASDSQGDISYSYNSDGEIEFVRTPTEFAYEFDSQLPDNSASEFKASAAAGGTMDVTISGSKGEADGENLGGSGGGCETGIGILALSLCMILFINKKH